MSVHININETVVAPYRTDIMANYGMGKYYLNGSDMEEQYSYDDYTFYNSIDGANPVVADKIIIHGNVYYTQIIFDEFVLVGRLFSIRDNHGEHYFYVVCNNLSLQYDNDTHLLSLYGSGKIYDAEGRHDYDKTWSGRIGCYDLTSVSDIDFTNPFTIHFRSLGSGHYADIMNHSRTLQFTNAYYYSSQFPVYFNYVKSHFPNGSTYLNVTSVTSISGGDGLSEYGSFRISYVNMAGEPVDLPSNTFLGDYEHSDRLCDYPYHYSYFHLSYIFGDGIFIPMSENEYDASMCANYRFPYSGTWETAYGVDFSQYKD